MPPPRSHHHALLVLAVLVVATATACETAQLSPVARRDAASSPPAAPAVDRPDAAAGGVDALAGIDPSIIAAPRDGGGEMGSRAVACPGSDTRAPASCAALGVVVDPFYAGSYTCFDLGPVPGVPPQKYGGLVLTLDKCSVTMLIGGEANAESGKLYKVPVTRDASGHINGFGGAGAPFIDAPYNDGGVTHAKGGVLMLTRWPSNELQQTLPGSTRADKVVDLAALGVAHASASLNFVPMDLPGGGALKLVAWPAGQWYTLSYQPDGQGMFDISTATARGVLPGGPEGFVYVAAGSPLFARHGMLVSEWSANQISTYQVDGEGNPELASRRGFLSGLRGAEGAFRDPATGDFFFSTWGQAADRVIVVRGFAPIVIVD